MTMFLAPYTAIADIDGSPLDAGFLFFGEYGKDPELFPVEVFWDADFTVPAAQPIRTRNGYPVRNGSPTKVYLKTAQHSIVIKNRNSAFILVDFKNKGWDASFVVDASGKTQQQINDSSIYSVGSVAAMLGLAEGLKNRIVQVKATGAMYRYDAEKAGVNDGVYVQNGWVLIGYHDVLLATLAGINGDGTNEYTKLKALLDVASTLNRPVNICGLTIHASSVVATGDIKLIGSGGIKLLAGSNGTLLTSAYNLEIDGEITLDQNKAENNGGTVTGESHCTIKHSGDNLILRNGAKVLDSASNNIVCRAKKNLILDDIEVTGGQIGVYAIAPLAKVTLRGGVYSASTLYDNIAIYNAEDVSISGVTSKDSTRSGIVVNNTSKKSRIIGNLCLGNKRDGSNQGGWGIVCSVNTLDTVVNSNVCLGNQTGGITLDTFPAAGVDSLDNRITVVGNTINGLYGGAYSTTGISLNDATHAVVTGNSIYKVGQGIATDSANHANITGNTIQDVTSFFVQLYRSNDSTITGNLFDGCSNTTGGAVSFADSSRFNCNANTVTNLTGAAGNAIRISGACTDWNFTNNKVTRSVAGSGFGMHILGAANTGGMVSGNTFKSTIADAWQWNIVSDNAAQFSTMNNTFSGVGTGVSRYAFQCNNATMGDDTVNGLRNYWTAEPTFKSRTGQVAVIAGALKYWNGTAWA